MRVNFEQIEREACKASIMIEGLTGRGKSGLALLLAFALAGGFREGITKEEQAEVWKKIFTCDTENRSLNLFVGIPSSFGISYGKPFGVQLSPEDGFAPSNYLEIREAAVQRGAEVFIADSITHMWTAKDGVLDRVNQVKQEDPRMDNYRVWGDPRVSDEKNRLMEVVRDHRCHVITTVRVKEKFDLQFNAERNKNEVVSLGEQQLQQDGLKYEPDLVLRMIRPGKVNSDGTVINPKALVLKSRYAIIAVDDEVEFTPALCEQLRQYLNDGVSIDDLLEAQRQDYIRAATDYLDSHKNMRAIWKVIKADAGFADAKLEQIPLGLLKHMYSQLTAE